ncbi:MAG: 3-deoxy-7-phosphoheptulonate synthase [Verrucomicrobiota bacterium]|nr:3-deoxy-7-phosphoheptulonate synthase [Verrucomicrobiota bacterium]
MTKNAAPANVEAVFRRIKAKGFGYEVIHGTTGINVIGVLGDLSGVEESYFAELDSVEKVVRISKPYKRISRQYAEGAKLCEKETRRIRVGRAVIGGPDLVIMAGPCSLESAEQVAAITRYVSELGIPILRGGAYKPRASPYSFQGLGLRGLRMLDRARSRYGLRIVTEATGLHHHVNADGVPEKKNVLENVIEHSDIVQVGARNMKSYGFLQELAAATKRTRKPVLLKRGDSSTLEEFLLAAEYVVASGNPNVMLCLRGIRAFEETKFQRYTADIGAIPVLKRECNLPVIFDPSHATGYRDSVGAISLAAVAAGADGLLIETHNCPAEALCDGEQSVTRAQLARIKKEAEKIRRTVCRG